MPATLWTNITFVFLSRSASLSSLGIMASGHAGRVLLGSCCVFYLVLLFGGLKQHQTMLQYRMHQIGSTWQLDCLHRLCLEGEHLAPTIASPLTRIINISLSEGVVPQEWKRARVTPLFKKGVATDMDNYRPISVLPAASKVLERVVH